MLTLRGGWGRRGAVAIVTTLVFMAAAAAPASTTVSAAPVPTGAMSGTVTVPAGHPAGDIDVGAYLLRLGDEGQKDWTQIGGTRTAADGSWRIVDLPAGTYRVGFTTSPWGNVVGEFLGDASTKFEGEDVVIAAGATVTGVDETLAEGATISGTVRTAAGAPLVTVAVLAYQAYDTFGSREWKLIRATWTDHEGRYKLDQLRGTTHRLAFNDVKDRGYVKEYFDDVLSIDEAKNLELREAGAVTGINARLAGGPVVVEPAPAKITRLKAPKITGTPKVARTLRATRGAWKPQQVKVKFRWFTKQGKQSVAIKRGTRQKLRLTKSLQGKRVRVRLTVSKPGHRTTHYATAWTPRIKRR